MKCNASCTGSCTATANQTCQEQCQESSYAQCRADLANQCTTQCQESLGAIFCNGSYINASNVEQCIQQLDQILSAKIAVSGSSSCTGDQCSGEAQGKASLSCSAATAGTAAGGLWAIGVAGAAVVAVRRRRERTRK